MTGMTGTAGLEAVTEGGQMDEYLKGKDGPVSGEAPEGYTIGPWRTRAFSM
jgi:hypothetical protein